MKKEHLEVLLEDIRSKVEVIAEGYDLLNRKIDRVAADLGQQIAAVDKKIDRVAADLKKEIKTVASDLAAHRADTEIHRGYRVAER